MCNKLSLLIVDDDPRQRVTLHEGIEEMGIFDEITAVDSEKKAIDIIENQKLAFNLVLLDLRMQRKDSGLRFLKKLKNNPDYKDTEVIVLTVVEDVPVRNEVMSSGADYYIEKCQSYAPLDIIRERVRGLSDKIKLKRLRQTIESNSTELNQNKAFVAFPYQPCFDDVFHLIKTVSYQAQVQTVRADNISKSVPLTASMFKAIEECLYFICDITHSNPNVMLELGYAMALHPEREILILCDKASELPVDIRGYVIQKYDRISLQGTLKGILENFFSIQK